MSSSIFSIGNWGNGNQERISKIPGITKLVCVGLESRPSTPRALAFPLYDIVFEFHIRIIIWDVNIQVFIITMKIYVSEPSFWELLKMELFKVRKKGIPILERSYKNYLKYILGITLQFIYIYKICPLLEVSFLYFLLWYQSLLLPSASQI